MQKDQRRIFLGLMTLFLGFVAYQFRPENSPENQIKNPLKKNDARFIPQPVHKDSSLELNPDQFELSDSQIKDPTLDEPLQIERENVHKPLIENQPGAHVAYFQIDEGVAVIHGDIVIGEPVGEFNSEFGYATVPPVKLWPHSRIAFHIQEDLPNPERVRQALALFAGSPIQFIPTTNEKDSLVFQDSTGVCKSYVGMIGGHQPLWISPRCGPVEIAHEIMHALGFIHEQNRSDRNRYIRVLSENIEEKYKSNFEMLPENMMIATGLSEFDFESLMIYPQNMFARGSDFTMVPLNPEREIKPTDGLSALDLYRLQQLYGKKNASHPAE